MAVDIHAYIEIDVGDDDAYFSDYHTSTGQRRITSLTTAEFRLPREMRVFWALGLTSHREPEDKPPPFPARGIPEFVSDDIFFRYYLPIGMLKKNHRDYYHPIAMHYHLRGVHPDEASRWIEEGRSHYGPERRDDILRKAWRPRVSDPDWHTPSYLYYDELEQALDFHEIDTGQLYAQYRLFLMLFQQATKEWESMRRVRMVYWFDN